MVKKPIVRQTGPSAAIADLYEAALDPSGLTGIPGFIRKTLGVDSAGIWLTEGSRFTVMELSEDAREGLKPYLAHFHKLDPWHQGVLRRMDRVVIGCESIPEDRLVRTEFYCDFARFYGMIRPMGVSLRLGPGVFGTIAAHQPATKHLFEEKDKRPLERLLPHLRRALQLHRRIGRAAPPGWAAAALDAMSLGLVICDEASNIAYANSAAERLAREGAGIVMGRQSKGGGALVVGEAKRLAALIAGAARGDGSGAMRLTGRDGHTSLLLIVAPLPARFHPAQAPAHVLVALRRDTDDPSFSGQQLAALFGLSPTQAAVALGLYADKSFEEIAAERGIEVSTVRTHYGQVLARTGASGLRDLVRLLGMLPPLR